MAEVMHGAAPARSAVLQAPGLDAVGVAVRDLGECAPELQGILCPVAEIGAARVGITAQFLDDAESYHQRYSNTPHFEALFRQAFDEAGLSPQGGARLLDIGAGSGANTVVPCLSLFPGCHITATDLSPDLLRMLRRFVCDTGQTDRVLCLCTDAMNDIFRPNCFDVVVGAAILHHLLDPVRALAAAHRALKPGGWALFLEPFEGAAILRVAFDLILERAAREKLPLDPEAARLLAAMSLDYATRAGSNKTAPHFRHMDDKWLFTQEWLRQATRRVGFELVRVVPHASHATLFRDFTTGLLRLGARIGPERLPDWAWETIRVFDDGFSADMKRDVLLEGTIVLRKAA